ncbi:DUF2125 domain-containing protein [Celeribacter sp.]|uniref:DUF2125 domain-containing protein n=1 Tax=Celeribacter sp. TaxID=1890673 RepID=UPI003A9394AF
MRKLLWLILIAVVVYSGYWLVGAKSTERAIAGWISARGAEGWQAEYDDLRTGGFPLRFDTTITALSLADPATGVAYAAPRLEINSASYAPTALSAAFASGATFATPLQRIDITHDRAGADLFMDAGPNLTLDVAAFALENLTVTSTLGWGVTLAQGAFDTKRHADTPLTHDIRFTARDFRPDDGVMEKLDIDGVLSDRFEQLDIALTATFDAPWDIHALEGARPQPTRIDIDTFAAKWGALDLQIAGGFDVDARGTATGKIALKARNWREMIEIATATGLIPADMKSLALRAGQVLAGLKGNAETIDADLTLADGMIVLGFIPIGPAPNFTIR